MLLRPGNLNKKIAIERPLPDDAPDGAGSGQWHPVAMVWAELQDALPSRSERLADGMNIASRPARVRMYYRKDVTPAMRFVLLRWEAGAWVSAGRTMQIVAGPAEIGNRDGLEFMVEDYSSAGNAA